MASHHPPTAVFEPWLAVSTVRHAPPTTNHHMQQWPQLQWFCMRHQHADAFKLWTAS